MSAMLEQSLEELKHLEGASVFSVGLTGSAEDDFGYECIEIVFALNPPAIIEGARCDQVAYEILCDPEGNGPGFFALSKTRLAR